MSEVDKKTQGVANSAFAQPGPEAKAPAKRVTFAGTPEVQEYDKHAPPSDVKLGGVSAGLPPPPASMGAPPPPPMGGPPPASMGAPSPAPLGAPPPAPMGGPPPASMGAPPPAPMGGPPPASMGASPPPPAHSAPGVADLKDSPSPSMETRQAPAAPGTADQKDSPFKDMPRDPNKLAAWLKENEGKLPADERAMLDKAIAGGKQIYAQGPPIQVDMSDQAKSQSTFSRFTDRVSKLASDAKDKISDFASTVKDKIQNTFSRDSKDDGPPRDPAKYAEWLQQNPQKLSPKEQALVGQTQDGPPRDPAQYAEWLSKNQQQLSPKEQGLVAHAQGGPEKPDSPMPGTPAAPGGHGPALVGRSSAAPRRPAGELDPAVEPHSLSPELVGQYLGGQHRVEVREIG